MYAFGWAPFASTVTASHKGILRRALFITFSGCNWPGAYSNVCMVDVTLGAIGQSSPPLPGLKCPCHHEGAPTQANTAFHYITSTSRVMSHEFTLRYPTEPDPYSPHSQVGAYLRTVWSRTRSGIFCLGGQYRPLCRISGRPSIC